MSLNGSAQSIGSPSRMRGKEGDELGLGQTIRITPACAVKRADGAGGREAVGDHPRACGEKCLLYRRPPTASGSPPRVRGKGLSSGRLTVQAGITPACAGKSIRPTAIPPQSRDHPRVCGEKHTAQRATVPGVGSPPRVRGKGAAVAVIAKEHGITPARAGKRAFYPALQGRSEDHPRACGEKAFQGPAYRLPWGSPPRVRGKVHKITLSFLSAGITPAYAGKSFVRPG